MRFKKFGWLILNWLPLLGLLTLVISVSNRWNWVHTYDHYLQKIIHGWQSPGLTPLVKIYTQLGNAKPFIFISIVILGMLLWRGYDRLAAFFLADVVLGNAINHLIKLWIQRPRPHFRLITIGGYSFPSGHSVAAMLLFGSLIFITTQTVRSPKWRISWILTCIILMLLLGLSRVYLNVHYPSDVTAGLLLGLVILQTTHWIFYRKKESQHAW